jgi:hypothetical protein
MIRDLLGGDYLRLNESSCLSLLGHAIVVSLLLDDIHG